MASAAYAVFRRAILEESQVVFDYRGERRTACPLILGHSGGKEKALVWQLTGPERVDRGAEGWRCLFLENVAFAELREGFWREGDSHRSEQRCVEEVDIDVNIHVRHRR